MLLPDTPIWPALEPSLRTPSTSSPLTRLVTIEAVTLPVLKSLESLSVTVALLPLSSSVALAPSV